MLDPSWGRDPERVRDARYWPLCAIMREGQRRHGDLRHLYWLAPGLLQLLLITERTCVCGNFKIPALDQICRSRLAF
jgi:hypothetical protein